MSVGKECYVYTANNDVVSRKNEAFLLNEHEEADTCIALHLSHVDEMNSGSEVVVQCNDAHVVILIYHI